MKWLGKFLKKPDAKPSVPAIAPTSASVEDCDRLRAALATAEPGERPQRASRLGEALAARAQAPLASDPPEVWIAAICQAPDKTLALAWMASLAGDAHLAEVATRARGAEARFAAAQRIESSATLEQVAQASRDKDKRVYRHCGEVLRQRRQAEADTRRAREISDELGRLIAAPPLPGTALLDLKKESSGLTAAGDAGLECQALLERAFEQLRQEAEARRALQLNQEAATTLATECAQAVWPWYTLWAGWRQRLDALRAPPPCPAWLAEQAAARTLDAALAECESRLDALADDAARFMAGEAFLAPLEGGTPLAVEKLDEITAAWAALLPPANTEARQALESRWLALRPQTQVVAASQPEPEPKPAPRAKPRIDQDAVREHLDRLEAAVEAGHLIDADAAAKQIKAVPDIDGLRGALAARWHELQARLEQLRGWARWGTGQARDHLIEAAEALLTGEHAVEQLATAIPALREEWKRLNAHGAAAKGQWERFDAALEQAYQPVAVERAETAARQAEARAARAALCDAWTTELSGIDWAQANFKQVEALRATWIAQWRAAPRVSFRDERELRKTFDALIGAIDQRLDAARAEELGRRERLIEAAEALLDQPDLARAIAESKALQADWNKTTVRLRRKDEEKLWRRFRAACNAVFERRDAQRAEQAEQQREQARERQHRLDAFAALLAGADAGAIKRALERFHADWGDARSGSRSQDAELSTRARDLQERARRRLDQLRAEQRRGQFELLARKAALADRVEAAALAGEPLDRIVDAAKQAWDALPALPGGGENLLSKRFSDASGVSHTRLAAGRATREALLLDLEIALGLPSPEAHAQARRERQLTRLREHFDTATRHSVEAEALLIQCYATAAPADPDLDRRLAVAMDRLASGASLEA